PRHVKRQRPNRACLANIGVRRVRQIARRLRRLIRQSRPYCGKQLRVGLRNQRPRLQKVLKELLDVLVVDVELFLQSVEFWVAVELPPLAAQHGILRLRYLPAVRLLKLRRRLLISGRKRRSGRSDRRRRRMILRPDHATSQQKRSDRRTNSQ